MPYIVTTKRLPEGGPNVPGWRESRRAVATLEEAYAEAHGDIVCAFQGAGPDADYPSLWDVALNWQPDESGGTIGPLPDGTVIEVEPVGAIDLFHRAALRKGPPYKSVAEVIDAFNARQP